MLPPPSKKAKTKYCITISELAEYFSIYQARFEAITVFCRFCVLWAFWSCSHYVKYPPSHLTGKGVQCDNNMCTYSHLAIWLILRSSLWQPGFTVLLHGSIRHSTLFSGGQSPKTTTKITDYQTKINVRNIWQTGSNVLGISSCFIHVWIYVLQHRTNLELSHLPETIN